MDKIKLTMNTLFAGVGMQERGIENSKDEFRCSVCGLHLEDWIRLDDEGNCYEYEFKYCPKCGAKMDEDE